MNLLSPYADTLRCVALVWYGLWSILALWCTISDKRRAKTHRGRRACDAALHALCPPQDPPREIHADPAGACAIAHCGGLRALAAIKNTRYPRTLWDTAFFCAGDHFIRTMVRSLPYAVYSAGISSPKRAASPFQTTSVGSLSRATANGFL